MRVSERMRYDQVAHRVDQAKASNVNAMDRLSSQKEIRRLSDNPVGAAKVIRYRDHILDLRQFQKNIDYSKGYLERSESAIQSLTDGLIRAKELAVSMSNDTFDAASRDATAQEVQEIVADVVQLGNSTFGGRYVFGGFRTQTPPLSLEGDYLGDDGALFVQVSPGDFRQFNVPGRNLFEVAPDDRAAGHFNMVHTLEMLYEGLHSNDKHMIQTALSELDFQIEKTTSSHATIGAVVNSLDQTMDRLNGDEVTNRAQLSKIQDTDIYDASAEFRRTEAALQGTLLASTKLLQPSLLNFLQ